MRNDTPASLGYYFPAEFALHQATWLSWPHNPDTWPGKIETIFPSYIRFVKTLTAGEYVHINVADQHMEEKVSAMLLNGEVPLDRIRFFHHPTNDAWCRD